MRHHVQQHPIQHLRGHHAERPQSTAVCRRRGIANKSTHVSGEKSKTNSSCGLLAVSDMASINTFLSVPCLSLASCLSLTPCLSLTSHKHAAMLTNTNNPAACC